MESQRRAAGRGVFGRAALVATALFALAAPGAALATGTLDQESTAFGSARALIGTHENGPDVRQAQTFRAGASGSLDQVDLPIRVVGDPGVALTVEIRALDGDGFPAAVLGSATVQQADVPACNDPACIDKSPTGDFTTFVFTSVALSTPATVSAGTDYAIVLSATGAQLDIYGDMIDREANRYEWAGTSDDSAYADGTGLGSTGGVWGPSNADKAFRTFVSPPVLEATVGQPINADGSSTFKANKGVVPVRFTLSIGGTPTCSLPAATIALTRTSGADPGPVNEGTYLLAADSGSSFRIADCTYVYNVSAKALPPGDYRVDIKIDGQTVGSAAFELR